VNQENTLAATDWR